MTQPNKLSLLALVALASQLAGCAGTTGAKPTTVADDTEMVTPIGSHIPAPVKKGSTAQTASPTDVVTGDAARQMLSPGAANGQARGGN